MGRRKKFLSAPIPFFPFKFRINRKTFFNIIGLIILTFAFILFISFIIKGKALIFINEELRLRMGAVSILFPILMFFVSCHFFSTKKLSIIKPHITLGFFLIIVALLGIFKSGEYGKLILESLIADFSFLGAIIILFVTFISGVILFFNTSLDVFFISFISVFKHLGIFLHNHIFKAVFEIVSKKNISNKISFDKDQFIKDTISEQKLSQEIKEKKQPVAGVEQEGIKMKPLFDSNYSNWVYPPLSLLTDVQEGKADYGDIGRNSQIIEETLDSFGIRAKVAEVNRGPTVTQYALEIVKGTKLSKITALSNDLALALAAPTGQVRIEAPIPGRALVGIEIPNKRAQLVTIKSMLSEEIMSRDPRPLLVPLGLDVSGKAQATDITAMPHVLIAGTTGSGKSVLLNTWIASILFRTTPQQVRMILVDPKRVEMTLYNGIPHLLTEVIVEPKKIISALKWTVSEMENRYKIFASSGARNIASYNAMKGKQHMYYLLFVIDELADLMVFAPGEVEELITRIAQMARATGIHLLLATQRPSVDVITGLMKANIPARIAFNVASMIDSRVVLDTPGAEKLLGKGDMLYLPPDQAKPKRIQGAFISERDVIALVDFLRKRTPKVQYTEEITEQEVYFKTKGVLGKGIEEGKDPLFEKALEAVIESNQASASYLQRRLSIGYARAARILDQLEAEGYVGPSQGAKPREILSRIPKKNVEEVE